MATAVVSGRVDERIKARAEMFIRAAGLSTGDVVRMVWERIARTGEVPDVGDAAVDSPAANDSLTRLGELRTQFGTSDELVALTDAQMREMIARHHA